MQRASLPTICSQALAKAASRSCARRARWTSPLDHGRAEEGGRAPDAGKGSGAATTERGGARADLRPSAGAFRCSSSWTSAALRRRS